MAQISLKDINEAALSPEKMIAEAEADYEKKVREVAERVFRSDGVRLLLIAGPSGSGKTTTANLIADALRAMGEEARVVSLDDFYRDCDDPLYPKQENGERDYECPEALNLPELSLTLERIAAGEDYEIPKYDFKVAKRVSTAKMPPIGNGCVIIEGLHALNPKIAESLPKKSVLKLFVSVSTNIDHEGERLISGRKIRFVRRLVRDSIYRAATAERTLAMWHGVLAAEDIYLYPYKHLADISFDTFHTFELGVMRGFFDGLISEELAAREPYAATVENAVLLSREIDISLVPETSLIREFIPGGIYDSLY